MATPQQEPLRAVTAEEHAALERLVQSSSERVDRVRRATALLAVVQGQGFAAAARQAGIGSSTTVAKLVARFNRQGLAAVSIAAGRGRKPTYAPAARACIVATAQRPPDRKTDGTATWSLSTLERTLRRAGFPRLGARPSGGCCRMPAVRNQKTRTWCPTGTAERKRKSGIVRVSDPQTEVKRG
jgi:transposase